MVDEKDLEKIILPLKPKVKNLILEDIALNNEFKEIEPKVFNYGNDYLLLNDKRITYLTDLGISEYSDVKKNFEFQREQTKKYDRSLMANAFSLGWSVICGGALGYVLISVLHCPPFVMVPCMVVPAAGVFYSLIKKSMEINKIDMEVRKSLQKYEKKIHYDNKAIKIFSKRLWDRIVWGNP